MKIKTFMLIIALVVFVGTILGFMWLWNDSKVVSTIYTAPANLQPVEIQSIKNSAVKMLNGLEKNSDIPIDAPIASPAGKMGRTNPFDGIK